MKTLLHIIVFLSFTCLFFIVQGSPQKKLNSTTAMQLPQDISILIDSRLLTITQEKEINDAFDRLKADGFPKLIKSLINKMRAEEVTTNNNIPSAVSTEIALSPTEAYLETLGTTRAEAYNKIENTLTAPNPLLFTMPPEQQIEMRKNKANYMRVKPQEYDTLINQVIAAEKQHPDYYVLYNGNDKSVMFLHLFTTYIAQLEHNWNRDDFFIMRSPHEFYKKPAETAADYIRQNTKPSKRQQSIKLQEPIDITKQFIQKGNNTIQFDMAMPVRVQLLSTSPAFIACVDNTDIAVRNLLDGDFPAWESSFYYFATNLSWANIDLLSKILLDKIKEYCPEIFADGRVNALTREYITLRFGLLPRLFNLKPKKYPPNKKGKELVSAMAYEEEQQVKGGIVYQIFIPRNIIDNIAYLSWQNGIVWQRKINGITDGWDDELGAYTKVSPILDILQKNPQRLGQAVHLLQVRLIFKDEKYLFDPASPIKMNIITTLPESLMRSVKEIMRSLATVVFEFKQAAATGTLEKWAERNNLDNEILKLKSFKEGSFDSFINKK